MELRCLVEGDNHNASAEAQFNVSGVFALDIRAPDSKLSAIVSRRAVGVPSRQTALWR